MNLLLYDVHKKTMLYPLFEYFFLFSCLLRYNIYRITAYSKANRAYRMRRYFKFVFVRHPLTRLVSAYRQKIEFNGKRTPFIMKHLRSNTSDKSPVSFQEFTSFVLRGKGKLVRNEHWATYNNLCNFCEVQYDFIGRLEFLEKDAHYLFQKQFPKYLHADFKNDDPHWTGSDLAVTKKYFTQLTEENKQGLLHLYRKDMDMFGYKSSDVF